MTQIIKIFSLSKLDSINYTYIGRAANMFQTLFWALRIEWWMLLLLVLSRFSRVRLCATPWTAAHQAPPSMDFPGKSAAVECHQARYLLKIFRCLRRRCEPGAWPEVSRSPAPARPAASTTSEAHHSGSASARESFCPVLTIVSKHCVNQPTNKSPLDPPFIMLFLHNLPWW